MKRSSKAARQAKSGRVMTGLLLAVLGLALMAAGVYVFFLRSFSAADRISKLWSQTGVEKPNVLLLTLDTTRADHLPAYGYSGVMTPVLDRLASGGVVFEQCTSASPLTLPSHCTIMTGTYPNFHNVRVNGNAALSEIHLTLAEVFKENGYVTGAFIGAFVLDGRWGLAQGFDRYDDDFDLRKFKQIDLGTVQRPGNEVIDSALAWLEEIKDSPFFGWIHLYDPHLPYSPPEPFASEYGPGPIGLYDGEIAFMDSQIGRLVDWLHKEGLAQRTVIILVGDHGEGLGEHGEFAHGYFIYDYAVQVPLIMAAPLEKMNGVRIKAQVSTVDVFPSVLELVGLKEQVDKIQGRSLVPLVFDGGGSDMAVYSESLAPNVQFGWSPLFSLREGRFKYIDAPRPELFNLTADRLELENIYGLKPDLAREMKAKLEKLMAENESGAVNPEAANLDRDTVERLAALGYVGAPGRKTSGNSSVSTMADPKDKLDVYNSIQQGGELITQEKYAEAYDLLKKAVDNEPGIPQAHLLLATCAVELGRKEEARVNLDLILRESPDNVQAMLSMADLLLEEGKKEDVLALCKQALSVDERNAQALALMGEVHLEEKDFGSALPYLEKAVEFQPKLTQNKLNLAACLAGLKDYGRAEVMLAEILNEYPKFPLAKYHMGLLYEEQGRLEDAVEAYSEEIETNPRAYRARFNMGRIKLKLGDSNGYLEDMREVVRIAPRAPEGYLFLARGLLNEPGRLDEVLELVNKGLELARDPELKALGYFLLADVYDRLSRPDLVRQALEKANYFKNLKGRNQHEV